MYKFRNSVRDLQRRIDRFENKCRNFIVSFEEASVLTAISCPKYSHRSTRSSDYESVFFKELQWMMLMGRSSGRYIAKVETEPLAGGHVMAAELITAEKYSVIKNKGGKHDKTK